MAMCGGLLTQSGSAGSFREPGDSLWPRREMRSEAEEAESREEEVQRGHRRGVRRAAEDGRQRGVAAPGSVESFPRVETIRSALTST
eukprot:scaffold318459_cov31-Tisochrysis_lutea.AAC.4